MALIEVVTDHSEIRRTLVALGLPYAPVSFAGPRDPDEPANRGPPHPHPPDAADSPLPHEFGDPPGQDDGPILPDDDASRLPPDPES